MSTCSLLVSGAHFGGRGHRAVVSVIEELLSSVQQELHILAYVVQPSANEFLSLVEDALRRGISLRMVVNEIPGETITIAPELRRLAGTYRHAKIVKFEPGDGSQLHAKVLVVDRAKAVVGSANFSWSAWMTNHEVGVLLSGEEARELAEMTDVLVQSGSPL